MSAVEDAVGRQTPRPSHRSSPRGGPWAAALALALLGATLPSGEAAADAGPFSAGRSRISITGGTAGGFGERYLILGGGYSYYIVDGLELGVDADYLFLNDPSIFRISPQVRYVLHFVPVLKPYAGVFYRYVVVGERDGIDYDNFSSVGSRLGAFYVSGGGSFFGGGVVFERLLGCDEKVHETCTDIYPEIVISISF